MKNQMYIALLALPLLAGCGNKKETSHAMPVPEISVCPPKCAKHYAYQKLSRLSDF